MIWLILGVGRGLTEIAAFRYEEEGRGPACAAASTPLELAEG